MTMVTTSTTPMGESDSSNSSSKNRKPAKVRSLFHFSSTQDKLQLGIGILCGVCYGIRYIAKAIVIGTIGSILSIVSKANVYTVVSSDANGTAPRTAIDGIHLYSIFQETYGLEASLAHVVTRAIFRMVVIMGAITVVSWLAYFGMTITLDRAAVNQVNRIRMAFVKSILKQDIDWFDNCQTSKFISQTENDFKVYQNGIGFKLGNMITYISAYLLPFVYCMVVQWRLALVGYSTAPVFVLSSIFTTMVLTLMLQHFHVFNTNALTVSVEQTKSRILNHFYQKMQRKYSDQETKSYSDAGVIAEDVLTAIKTVVASNGQVSEAKRYSMTLVKGKRSGIVKTVLTACGNGFFLTSMMTTFALSGWYAYHLYQTMEDNDSEREVVADLIAVTSLINISGNRIGELLGLANYVSMAMSASSRILDVINKLPLYDCDTNSTDKHLITTISDIEFKDVEFHYSSRKDVKVLRNFNLHIRNGERVALVGNSGSGKSTVVSLLHRFYEPVKGSVRINGYDIKELNLGWLRSQIGVVSQEPVLFPTTIYENIRYGCAEATMEDIEMAAKMANAHNFIMDLPLKYETNVGDRGTQLSGGQKQRIAIARALIRKPPILLLDEATSALDSQSEQIVQQALDNASVGRTSIIIAHRLSTIRNADKIVVMSDGQIVESGSHDSLMQTEGVYYRLVKVQMECTDDKQGIKNVESNKKESEEEPEDITKGELTNPKETKVDIFDQKISQPEKKSDLSSEVMKFKKRFLSIRNMSFYRILTLGGWGPLFMCSGVVAGAIRGAALSGFYVCVIPYINYMFDDSESRSLRGLFQYLDGILKFGVTIIIADFLMNLFSGLSGTFTAKRLRDKLFYSLMRQEVAWYDQSNSSVGSLCLILSHNIENLKMTLNSHLNVLATVTSQTITALVVLFNIAWHYGSVTAVCIVVALTLAIYTKRRLHKTIAKEGKKMKISNEILRDIVMNIRTIRLLHAEEEFEKLYSQSSIMKNTKKEEWNRYVLAVLAALMDSLSQFAIIFIGLMTPYLYIHNKIVLLDFFRALGVAGMANIFGRVVSVIPDVVSTMASVEEIFKIIDRRPEMDNFSQKGTVLSAEQPGTLHLDGVTFSYPARPKCKALENFEIDVKNHQTIAIVGSSGSGKSTCIQLAARFYDPHSGSVFVCDELVDTIQLHSLRETMAIVQQEPMMFNRSIAENIAYGDLSRVISMEEIVEAAKIARAHGFISKLPQGYETVVGNRGTQISGGQKQRLAIARALIRKPKLLFLDEATSALDSETDKEVQAALKQHCHKTTVVIIAHRLSTITDADQIFVVHRGRVVEKGTHNELMDLNGFYADQYKNVRSTPWGTARKQVDMAEQVYRS